MKKTQYKAHISIEQVKHVEIEKDLTRILS